MSKKAPVKLILSKNENNTWNKFLINLSTNHMILEHTGIPLYDSINNKEYFDDIIELNAKHFNITEIERFI